jgi:Predicted N-acetylglucosaminyl transferase
MKVFLIIVSLAILNAYPLSAQDPTLSSKSKKAIELYTLADNFRVRGQYERAIELLKESIDKDKKFEEAYYRLALTYRSSGDLLKSIENFETGLSLTTDVRKQKTYAFQLGDTYLRVGNYQKSLYHLNEFLKLGKNR